MGGRDEASRSRTARPARGWEGSQGRARPCTGWGQPDFLQASGLAKAGHGVGGGRGQDLDKRGYPGCFMSFLWLPKQMTTSVVA